MARLKNFARNLATSYFQLGANVVYSLISIPLILYWLPKAEFGLWALLVQIMGYSSLINFGMTSAISRLLIDHKDDRSNGNYGSMVKTAFLVNTIQGGIILGVVLFAAPSLAALMRIPTEYHHVFIVLLRWFALLSAIPFCFRPLGMMLYAHQREDVPILSNSLTLLLSLGFLWLFLWMDQGLYAFIEAGFATILLSPVYNFWYCCRLKVLPRRGEWGTASWKTFSELFAYAKDVFLFTLGKQLTTASQVIIVSRVLGLGAAAVWAVGTKIFTLCLMIIDRSYMAAAPGLYEMQARGESARLKMRFKNIVSLTASMGAWIGVSLALCNSLFVGVWTAQKIAWPSENDLFLGVWILINSMSIYIYVVSINKKFGAARYIYIAEGGCFIVGSLLFGKGLGMPGIIAISVICNLLFSYQYGLRRSARFFQCGVKELALDWVSPALKLLLIFGTFAVLIWFATASLPTLWRMILNLLLAGTVGGYLFLRIGIPAELLKEISPRLPRPAAKLLRALVPHATAV